MDFDDVIEHVMRLVDHDVQLTPFARAQAPGFDRRRAVGRLLGQLGATSLPPGTPLAAWLADQPADPLWRERVVPTSASLWSRYVTHPTRDPRPVGSTLYEHCVRLLGGD